MFAGNGDDYVDGGAEADVAFGEAGDDELGWDVWGLPMNSECRTLVRDQPPNTHTGDRHKDATRHGDHLHGSFIRDSPATHRPFASGAVQREVSR